MSFSFTYLGKRPEDFDEYAKLFHTRNWLP